MNADRTRHLNDALTAPQPTVSGITLRPLSIGSMLLLQRTQNKLFTTQQDPEALTAAIEADPLAVMPDLLAYVFIHAADLPTVQRLCHGPLDSFHLAVSEFACTIDMAELPAIADSISMEKDRVSAAVVEPVIDEDGEGDSDPNVSGQSGHQA